MTTTKPSLDYWRDYFRRGGDSDIFEIIDHAIMVAATDYPNKFRSNRDKIAERLFSCSRCIKLSVPGEDGEANNHFIDEAEALSDEIEEFSVISKEVVRIKEILLNKEDEANSVLVESLRKLKLMSLNVDILKSTEIGKAVNSLRKHDSDKIRLLAKTLISEWKEMVDQWVNTTKEITGEEGTPESVNPSVLDEEEAFPSLPYGVDIFTPNGFEFSHFFDSLDIDTNPCNSGAYETTREHERSISKRRPESTEMRIHKPSSATDFDETSTKRPLKQDTKQRMKNELVSTQRPVVTEQTRKALGPQQEVSVETKLLELKGLDSDAKFECAKRKLQESYQQHNNAKKQRTIQVLDTIPKQSSAQKPQLKRPGMNRRNWANGRK